MDSVNLKTSELSDGLLDAAVAKALGKSYKAIDQWSGYLTDANGEPLEYAAGGEPLRWRPHADWRDCGPIISQTRINIRNDGMGIQAACHVEFENRVRWWAGSTEQEAVCRAFVALKLGDEVQAP